VRTGPKTSIVPEHVLGDQPTIEKSIRKERRVASWRKEDEKGPARSAAAGSRRLIMAHPPLFNKIAVAAKKAQVFLILLEGLLEERKKAPRGEGIRSRGEETGVS